MAVTAYTIGYRTGAVAGSTVGTFSIIDDTSELPTTANLGDLAFAKNQDKFFIRRGIGWDAILVQYLNSDIRNDLIIQKIDPNIRMYNTKYPANTAMPARFAAGYNNRPEISSNIWNNGSAWVKDDVNLPGFLIIVGPGSNSFDFYTWPVGGTFQAAARIGISGELYEKKRGNFYTGMRMDQGADSNLIVAGNAVPLTSINSWRYHYSLAGDILTIWFEMSFTFSGIPNNIFVKFPLFPSIGVRPTAQVTAYDMVGVADTVWSVGRAFTNPNWDSFCVSRLDNSSMTLASPTIIGRVSFPIQGI